MSSIFTFKEQEGTLRQQRDSRGFLYICTLTKSWPAGNKSSHCLIAAKSRELPRTAAEQGLPLPTNLALPCPLLCHRVTLIFALNSVKYNFSYFTTVNFAFLKQKLAFYIYQKRFQIWSKTLKNDFQKLIFPSKKL